MLRLPRGADRLNPFNHFPHFAFFMTHFTDSMPISSIGGIRSADLWNPKYPSHVYKVTVAVDMLGNIIWICPLAPGTLRTMGACPASCLDSPKQLGRHARCGRG